MTADMYRVNLVFSNEEYKSLLDKITDYELDRKFCKHTLEHFLDTARIMYIISLEENIQIKKDIIYATALLHDMGRVMQYEKDIPHDIAGAEIAEKILLSCEYSQLEADMIAKAILSHREEEKSESVLGKLLYRADKLSRLCFGCTAEKDCYWSREKKNMEITY